MGCARTEKPGFSGATRTFFRPCPPKNRKKNLGRRKRGGGGALTDPVSASELRFVSCGQWTSLIRGRVLVLHADAFDAWNVRQAYFEEAGSVHILMSCG